MFDLTLSCDYSSYVRSRCYVIIEEQINHPKPYLLTHLFLFIVFIVFISCNVIVSSVMRHFLWLHEMKVDVFISRVRGIFNLSGTFLVAIVNKKVGLSSNHPKSNCHLVQALM